MNPPLIKLAENKDFKELAQMYFEEFSKPPYNEPWTIQKALCKIEIFSRYCKIYSIFCDNVLVGFTVINESQWCPGEIVFGEEMVIKKEYQNKGIGTKVFGQIFAIYKNKGYSSFMGIANSNSKAINLYKKLGLVKSKVNILIEKKL